MSEPFIQEAKSSSVLVKLLVGTVAVAVIAALGVFAFKFISYKESGGIPTNTSFAQVAISYPSQGAQLEVSDPVKVEATAIGSTPFTSMELWINGKLVGLQTAPSGGAHPFSTFFSWIPVEEGIYSLISAAIDADGNKEISAQMIVSVVQTETGIEQAIADLNGSPSVMPPPYGGGYSPPDKPNPNESEGLSGIWRGSMDDWVTSLMAEVQPTAPELFATAGECGALLQIRDLSDNEEGFAVYRQVGISPTWVKITTLSSQSDMDWITYIDEGIFGAVNYYVTAFNSQGESKSNFVLVSIDPGDCPSEVEEIIVGKVGVELQIPALQAEMIYCYLSTDGVNWVRSPQSGFLPSEGESVQIEIVALDLSGNGSGEEQVVPEMNLFMECWGWNGGNLEKIGKIDAGEIYPQADSSLKILGEGLQAELKMETSVMLSNAGMHKLGPLTNFDEFILENPDLFDWQDITSDILPTPKLVVGYDPEFCEEYLPPDAQNIFGKLIYCFPYPAYDPDKGGKGPQPYLGWDFDGYHYGSYYAQSCLEGKGADCVSYPNLLSIAEETGGQVGFTVTALQNGKKTVWNVTEPDLKMFVVPPMACPGDVQYSVRLWYRPGKEGVSVSVSPDDQISEISEMSFSPTKVYYSKESIRPWLPCTNSPDPNWTLDNQAQYLDLEFSRLHMFGIDDGDNDFNPEMNHPESLELYGYFRVKAPSMGYWDAGNCMFPELGGCGGDQPWNEPYLAYTYRYLLVDEWETEGDFRVSQVKSEYSPVYRVPLIELENELLCQSTTKYSCEVEGQGTSFEIRNNTIRVYVTHLDALKLQVKLVDFDEGSDDDVACVGTKLIPSKTLEEWSSLEGAFYTIYGEATDSGDCEIDVFISAVGEPVQVDTHWTD